MAYDNPSESVHANDHAQITPQVVPDWYVTMWRTPVNALHYEDRTHIVVWLDPQ
jgi:hypothetical protein